MRHRFYAPEATRGAGVIPLPEDEADHLRRVLRLRAGDEIGVFDGDGREFVARVAAVERSRVLVSIEAAAEPASEMRTAITLAQAVLKSDKMDGVIRDAVMLGAAAIQPIVSALVDVPAVALGGGGRVERWTRVAIASSKQCGRAVVPRVGAPQAVEEWIGADRAALRLMLVEPGSGASARPLRDVVSSVPDSASVLVGPEGGWAAEEIDLALGAGRTLVSLGGRTLRADAVPLVVLSNLQFAWM